MVRIVAFQAIDPGSNPGRCTIFYSQGILKEISKDLKNIEINYNDA
jgi:hypothetical protein